MIILEALSGRHPWEGYGAERLEFEKDRPTVPIDHIDDEDWRRLLTGLLHKEWQTRWTADEVRAWLRGERPPLPRPSSERLVFEFAGRRCKDEVELATALAEEPEAATELMEGRHQIGELEDWLVEIGNTAAADSLDAFASRNRGPDYRVARFISTLDPSIPPTCRGRSVARRHLPGLAGEASRDPGGEAGQVVAALHRDDVLRAFPGHPELEKVYRKWRDLEIEFHDAVSELQDSLGEPPDSRTFPVAVLLGLASARWLRWPLLEDLSQVVRSGAGRNETVRSVLELPALNPRLPALIQGLVDTIRLLAIRPGYGRQLAVLEYQHRAAESTMRTRRSRATANRQQLEANRAFVNSRFLRYLGWAVVYVLGMGVWAADETFRTSDGFRSAAVVLAIYAVIGLIGVIGLDRLAARSGMNLRERRRDARWVYWVAAIAGVALIAARLDNQILQSFAEREIWAAPVVTALAAHALVSIPDRDRNSADPSHIELIVTWVSSLFLAAALLWHVWPVAVDVFAEYGSARSPWAWVESHRVALGALLLSGVLLYLMISAPMRLKRRRASGRGRLLVWATAISLLFAAGAVFAELDTFSWIALAGWLGFTATGLQLLVGRRPPRLFWMVVGLFVFWHAARYWVGLGRADVAGVSRLLAAAWSVAGLRLAGVGMEELI